MDPITLGLPHRSPFLFVDTVEFHEPGKRATAKKVFTGKEDFFAGHFPGEPIVPGVLLVEALAQTAGIAANGVGEALPFRLCGIRQMKILAAVLPGQLILLEATLDGSGFGMFQFEVRASFEGITVAEGRITLALAKA